MDTPGSILKRAREAKKLTLTDISAQTNIGVQYLEAIERDDLSLLPQTYMRAFVREFAAVVGVDAKELTLPSGPQPTAPDPTKQQAAPSSIPRVLLPEEKASLKDWFGENPWFARGGLMFVMLGVLAGALWFAGKEETSEAPPEIPFQSVVKENEARVTPLTPKRAAEGTMPVIQDTLRLQATTLDTVWLQIIVDNGEPQEYLFYPNRKFRWVGLNRFVLTLGNAGGLSFTLNDVDLGTLGKPGVVIRNKEITRQSVPGKAAN